MDEADDQRESPDVTLPTVYEKGRRETPGPPRPTGGDLIEGATLGRYRIVRQLGHGGMGSVYEAVHLEINKTVALKVLSAALAADQRARQRFEREALAASRLEHPCVVKVTDFGSDGDVPYLVMELLRGEDLAAAIDRQPRGLPWDEAVDVMLPVCAGVFAAHSAGIVHRDLKPRNIFLARNMVGEIEPKVLDFGISKVDGDESGLTQLTASGALLGTVPYLSPEHVKGGVTDARSDQYTLGVVLFECLAGRPPHEGHTPYVLMQNIAEGRYFPLSARRADLPPELEQDILRAMSIDPMARFASVYELGQALLRFASPRKRVIWAEYFGFRPDEAALATSTPPPPNTAGTMMLPPSSRTPRDLVRPLSGYDPRPAFRPMGETRPGFGGPETRSQEVRPDTRSSAQPLSLEARREPRSRMGLVVAAGLVATAIAVMVKWKVADPTGTVDVDRPPAESQDPQPPPATDDTPAARGDVTITVAGAPAGAVIKVDGWPAQLPLRLPRSNRARELTVEAPGFQPFVLPFAPTEDGELRVQLQRTAPPPPSAPDEVTVQITSDPTGATVWLDGDTSPRGRTPIELTLPAGSQARRVHFRMAGYNPRIHTLVPRKNVVIDVALVKADPPPAPKPIPRSTRPKPTQTDDDDDPYGKLLD